MSVFFGRINREAEALGEMLLVMVLTASQASVGMHWGRFGSTG
jgi:hypothetical protein